VHIYGDNLDIRKEKAGQVAQALRDIPGAADVKAEQTPGLPMLRIRADRHAIARYGINATDVLDVVETIGGRELGVVLEGQKRSVLQARFGAEVLGDLERLRISAPALADAAPRLIPLALFVIFVLLDSIFGSVRLATLIFFNVPLAITGGLVALLSRGYPFPISAGVGFIALFAIAVLNGVVLVSYMVEKRQQGFGADEAAREGAMIRLRPVLMAAMVASFGFIPMALATSAGAEVQRPLATVVVGGLVTSTLLTLLVLPAVYGGSARRCTSYRQGNVTTLRQPGDGRQV